MVRRLDSEDIKFAIQITLAISAVLLIIIGIASKNGLIATCGTGLFVGAMIISGFETFKPWVLGDK